MFLYILYGFKYIESFQHQDDFNWKDKKLQIYKS